MPRLADGAGLADSKTPGYVERQCAAGSERVLRARTDDVPSGPSGRCAWREPTARQSRCGIDRPQRLQVRQRRARVQPTEPGSPRCSTGRWRRSRGPLMDLAAASATGSTAMTRLSGNGRAGAVTAVEGNFAWKERLRTTTPPQPRAAPSSVPGCCTYAYGLFKSCRESPSQIYARFRRASRATSAFARLDAGGGRVRRDGLPAIRPRPHRPARLTLTRPGVMPVSVTSAGPTLS